MEIGNSDKMLVWKQILREGDAQISRRTFNLIIGGVVLWGLLLNYLMVRYFGSAVVRAVASKAVSSTVIAVGYIILVFLGSWLIARPNVFKSLLGYHLIVLPIGILLCIVVAGTGYPVQIIRSAVGYTIVITGIFIGLGGVFPDFFLKLGRVLLLCLGILCVGELITSLLSGGFCWDWIGAALFSMYIGYDWSRCSVAACTADNAVDIASNIYLDIINLFLRILRLLNRAKRDD